jgi:FkbM family methyltransferase
MNSFLNISDINKLTSYEFEESCRGLSSFARIGDSLGLVRVLTRYKMFVDVGDTSLVPHLIMDGFWETPVTQCIARIVKEGDVCVDVGAHMGYYGILMSALAGGEGRTVAVEPNPGVARILKRTASINYPGFAVWEGAISNVTGEAVIHIPKNKTGDSSLLLRRDTESEGVDNQRVKVITMDQLMSELSLHRMDVIKIDAEGAEPLIFEGMEGALANNPEIKIVMEFSPHLYSEVGRFNEYLLSRFDIYRIMGGFKLSVVSPADLDQWSGRCSHLDLLLVRKGAELPF